MTLHEIQRQTELEYSQVEFKQELKKNTAETLEELSDTEYRSVISSVTGINNIEYIDNITSNIINMLVNPIMVNQGVLTGLTTIDFTKFVAQIATIEEIQCDSIDRTYQLAIEIIAGLDNILFDIEKSNSEVFNDMTGETDLVEKVYIYPRALTVSTTVDFSFPIPMVVNPVEWTEDREGGYLENKEKVTLGRGEAQQPKEALRFINRMQDNKWKMVNVDIDRELESFRRKVAEKNPSLTFIQLDEIVENRSLTLEHTYSKISEVEQFYFVWLYDFRGRAYSKGYDLNLQGDSFKKGMQIPIFTTPKADAILELWD